MMKRLGVSAFLLLLTVSVSEAQDDAAKQILDTEGAAPDFSSTSAANATVPGSLAVAAWFAQPGTAAARAFSAPGLVAAMSPVPSPADPATPLPKPGFVYGSREDYRWQLSLGFAWFRFRSSVFDSNEFGVKTTVTYFLNEWLGVEGSFTGAFGGSVLGAGDAKIAHYGGGPKVAWRQRRWEPWLHGVFGGAHEGPQIAAAYGRNSYSVMAGGGADYRWNPHLSYRVEGNYVHTAFFHQTQASFLLAVGVVVHF